MADTKYYVFGHERHAICTAVGHDTYITSGVIRIDTYEGFNKVRVDAYYVLPVSEADIEAVVADLGRIDCSLDFTQLAKFIRNKCDTLVVCLPDSPDDEEIVADDYYLALVRTDSFVHYPSHLHKVALARAGATLRDSHARVVNASLSRNKYHWTRVCGRISYDIACDVDKLQ